MAQVSLDFWQPGVPQTGCGGKHAVGWHEEQSSSVGLGQPPVNQRRPVGVRAPTLHRFEERARSGAARLTTGEEIGQMLQDVQQLVSEEPSTSWGTGGAERYLGVEEEVLDYGEEEMEEKVLV
ncbi:hypothetical protein NDU88_005574 [Pleurodeles waltl]|uniref:Uncharacterized protein n=1 Tax=Pleurodeles waltl TaxID=8319 RepID=A0AAV7UJ42_PLEWA|nr:hypothetical protein NDU88_005574 [Pleurodeles waltl]